MDILFDAMRKDKPLAEGEMFYGEEYTSYNPDTTPEGYWEEDDYFEEEEEDDNQITNVLHAMDSDRRSDNGDEDENLMSTFTSLSVTAHGSNLDLCFFVRFCFGDSFDLGREKDFR